MNVSVDDSWSGSDSNVSTRETLTGDTRTVSTHNFPARPPSPPRQNEFPNGAVLGERTALLRPDLPVESRPKGFRVRGIKGLKWNFARWKRRRFWAIFSYLLMAVALVSTIVLFGILRKKPRMGNGAALCLSDSCVHAASEVLWSLAPNYQEINPCTNFEELTCGGWKSRHVLDDADTRVNTFSVLGDDAYKIIRHILEGGYPGGPNHPDSSSEKMSKESTDVDEFNYNMLIDMYDACMNKNSLKQVALEPLSVILNQLVESFPEENDSEDKSFVAQANLYFAKFGWSTVVGIGPGTDDMNPDTQIISIHPPSTITLPAPQYYLDEKVTDNYINAIAKTMFTIIPGNVSNKEAMERAKALVALEGQFAEAIPPRNVMLEPEEYYNLMSYNETIRLAPELGIDKTLEALCPPKYDFKSKDMITSFPEYLANVSEIIQAASTKSLKDFFLWQAITAFASNLEALELRPYKDFRAELNGLDPDALPDRSEICTSHVQSGLEWILGRFYVEKAFPQEAQEYGDLIIQEVKAQYVKRFKKAEWMDDETRGLALEKLEKTLVQIGYPKMSPNTTDPKSLQEYYKNLDIGTSYFNNTVALNRFGSGKKWAQLAEPTDRNQWAMSPATVNAYNSLIYNQVVFPAAIMQFPVFDAKLPSYVSFGAFGTVAGHEISHSFDDTGRKFDSDGAYRNWWTNETIGKFEERAQCFIDQYSNYSVPDPSGGDPVPLDGKLVLGEVLADVGGLMVSYDAWQARRQDYPDQSLPGLDYFSQEQLFFVFFGLWYCAEQRPESLVKQVLTDPHPPSSYRIQGTLENSHAFKEAFNCPVKEPKCELW